MKKNRKNERYSKPSQELSGRSPTLQKTAGHQLWRADLRVVRLSFGKGSCFLSAVLAAAWMAGAPLAASAAGLDMLGSALNALGGDNAAASAAPEKVIARAFADIVGRAPTDSELRTYRSRMLDDGWTEKQVRTDLRNRFEAGNNLPSGGAQQGPEQIVRRAYQDILGREPDASGLRTFRSHIIDDGWTEQQVRASLRSSQEARGGDADKVIQRAYQDALGREPDPAGLEQMRQHMLKDGWNEQQIRANLRNSPEGKQKQADGIIQRAYQDLLGREPDPEGLAQMRQHMLKDGWDEQKIRATLKSSPEYQQKPK